MKIWCYLCGECKDSLGMNVDKECVDCQRKAWIRRRKEFYAEKRASGWTPEYRKRAGRKAYETRVSRLIIRDPVKYHDTLSRIESEDELKARRIRRKAKKEMLSRYKHHDEDIGKVIF